MPGDPHPRSAHRASPAAGLALLNPQALVRQAQARQARARHALIRQAVARRTRGPRATRPEHPAPQPRGRHSDLGDITASDGQPASLQAFGLQAVVRLAAVFLAAQRHGTDGEYLDGQRDGSPSATEERLGDPRRHLGGAAVARQSLGNATADGQGRDVSAVERQWPGGPVVRRPAAPRHRLPRAGHWPIAAAGCRPAKLRSPCEPQQILQSLLRGLAAVIVLAIVGLSAFFVIAEQRGGHASAAAPGSEPGIASREVDSAPLTEREVFPDPGVQPVTGTAGYRVTMTYSDSDCRTATIGQLGPLLDDYGCDQVVRARLTAPYGGYEVTAGVVNLADEAGAARVSELTDTLVENGRGSFGMLGGAAGDPLTEPLAQLGWQSRGHYLLYCVIARPDGQLVDDDDPYAARITAELVGHYLNERVVGQRTLDP